MAVGDITTLKQLFELIRSNLVPHGVSPDVQPVFRDFRAGDVRHSLADTSKANRLLSYTPTHRIEDGISSAIGWYVSNLARMQ